MERAREALVESMPPELVASLTAAARRVADEARPFVDAALAAAAPHVAAGRAWLNHRLGALDAATVVLLTAAVLLAAQLLLSAVRRALRPVAQRGVAAAAFDAIRALPPVRAALVRHKAKLRQDIIASRAAHAGSGASAPGEKPLTELPLRRCPPDKVLARLRQRAAADTQMPPDGLSRLSGAVYMEANGAHRALLDEAHRLYALTNPLHADAFPSVRQMEAEVVAMVAALLGGGPAGPRPSVCGAMTSGGTESILSAIKASRDAVAAAKGIREPEMVIGESAHAAYWKAADYFRIRLRVVRVGADGRLSGRAVARAISRNTVVVVASAPGFPHGLVDDVEGIAAAAARARVCCHVDACLGGLCLPFVRRLGRRVPPFDFAVRGVTSMSVDTHKFGMAHKGTSVVLYADPELRQHQYTSVTDWSGGLYISPGMAGSRPGALIASAWAALVHAGVEGLLAAAAAIMRARDALVAGIRERIPELEVIGEPEMGVVAFRARRPRALNIYIVSARLAARGWHLNALQRPPALHMCFTAMSAAAAPALLADLRAAVDEVAALAADPAAARAAAGAGAVPLYGMANASPDRGLLGEFLVAYQDAMLVP